MEVEVILVLYHIKQCRLFNAKYCLYICIKHVISEHILLITFLNKPKFIFLLTSNGFKYCYVIVTI